MLGYEKFGNYANQFNICSGRLNSTEDCWLEAALRELREEFKIHLNWAEFDLHFRNKNKNIRYIVKNNTPILIGKFQGLSRKPLNQKITFENQHPLLSSDYKEMQMVDWFYYENSTIYQLDKKLHPITTFAISVIKNAMSLCN